MGFRDMPIWFPEGPFIRIFATVCLEASVLAAVLRQCNTLPNVVFLDLLLLLMVARLSTSYWRAGVTTHVFFLWAGDTSSVAPGGRGRSRQIAPQPPLGWAACEVTLTHCKARGGALGHWQIVVWYPPARAVPTPAPLDPLPWFPIRSLILDWLTAMPVRAPLTPADLLPVAAVVRLTVEIIRLGRGRTARVVHRW